MASLKVHWSEDHGGRRLGRKIFWWRDGRGRHADSKRRGSTCLIHVWGCVGHVYRWGGDTWLDIVVGWRQIVNVWQT